MIKLSNIKIEISIPALDKIAASLSLFNRQMQITNDKLECIETELMNIFHELEDYQDSNSDSKLIPNSSSTEEI